MHAILLAFDIGTSGLKASLIDENLNVLRNVTTTYPTHRLPNGGCEQDATDWWMSAVRAMLMLRELAPEYVKKVDAIGVSGHMLMQKMPCDEKLDIPIWHEFEKTIAKYDSRGAAAIGSYERFEFYEQAKTCYCILQSGETSIYANIMRATSSCGTSSARAIVSSKVRQPGWRKPTVTTLRKNGRRLQCSGLPGSEDASSGQSSLMMAA